MVKSKKSVVVEFSVYPIDSVHFSDKIAKVAKVLDQCGMEYQIGPMSTSLRGEWGEVMSVIRACHDAVAQESERVITTLAIDERREEQHGLKERVDLVEQRSAG